MKLTDYRTLGKSGLIVSPLALGTMTFGNTQWGSTDEVSKQMFDQYVDAGGNFVDTADVYSNGESERLIGKFIDDRKLRDSIVLSTKYSFHQGVLDAKPSSDKAANPNSGGNGRKNLYRSVDNSLKNLGTDYIDMYWMHVWDMVTPLEEVLQSMDNLVKAGKIRYYGFSDMPAWYAAKGSALAKAYNTAPPIAQQMHYALTERTLEQEHIPSAIDSGQGTVIWSPLAYGFLTGKYGNDGNGNLADGDGRLNKFNPMFPEVTEKHWHILDVLRSVSKESGHSMAQLALAWVTQQKGVTSTLIGASKLSQLQANIDSLQIEFSDEHLRKLNDASKLSMVNPYLIFNPAVIDNAVFGGNSVKSL